MQVILLRCGDFTPRQSRKMKTMTQLVSALCCKDQRSIPMLKDFPTVYPPERAKRENTVRIIERNGELELFEQIKTSQGVDFPCVVDQCLVNTWMFVV
jgi:hypothetical protein